MYKRTERQEESESKNKVLNISLGSIKCDSKKLLQECNDNSVELLKTIDIEIGEFKDVCYWTEDFLELICVSRFHKDQNGSISFRISTELSTL